jgi:CPA2 family monovalent cation:H+ antiporter-2
MLHLPLLINDLAIILCVAALVTSFCRMINQPVVLGYIVAGLLVSPNIPFMPTITDTASIQIWAEIGVIFLLFGLGLEFSFKKLKAVGGPASITGIVEVIFMSIAGYFTGKLMGWNEMDSIFLGGILSISSTTIIIRAFDELGVKTRHYASIVFGVLIVEDLVAILLLVLLSTIAVSQQFQGDELFFSSLKLGFFLIAWFVGGIFFIPGVLRYLRKFLNDELLLVLSIALCLLMVVLATHAGFSPALGAFIMGSILAETSEGKRIEHIIEPMKNFFGAIFFVSVGMLITPHVLIEKWDSVLIITIVTVVGKVLSSSMGSLISGQTIKNSIQTGFSLAQIGEFSFIIATLGLTLNVTSDFLYPMAVAVSVITTFTTPYLIKYSEPFAQFVENLLPQRILQVVNRYSSSTQAVAVSNQARDVLRSYLTRLVLLTIVLLAITILSKELAINVVYNKLEPREVASFAAFLMTFLFSAPFFWALLSKKMTQGFPAFGTSGRLIFIPFALSFSRYIVVAGILGFQISLFFPTLLAALFLLVVSILGLNWFSQHLEGVYEWFEKNFLQNLNDSKPKKLEEKLLLPWEAHLASYSISQYSPFLGKSLEELRIREKYGVSIVLIERGTRKIKAPNKDEILFPLDTVKVIGTDDQLKKFREFIEIKASELDDSNLDSYGLKGCILNDSSEFLGKTIRDSGIREMTEGLVVGLERGAERIINPDTLIVLEEGDLLWIVGNIRKLDALA